MRMDLPFRGIGRGAVFVRAKNYATNYFLSFVNSSRSHRILNNFYRQGRLSYRIVPAEDIRADVVVSSRHRVCGEPSAEGRVVHPRAVVDEGDVRIARDRIGSQERLLFLAAKAGFSLSWLVPIGLNVNPFYLFISFLQLIFIGKPN